MARTVLDTSLALIGCVMSEELGVGHYRRATVLAKALAKGLGFDVELVLSGLQSEAQHNLFRHTNISGSDYLSQLMEQATERKASLVVLDLPWASAVFSDLSVFSGSDFPGLLIGVDGPYQENHSFDLVFTPSFLVPQDYSRSVSPVRFGWDCYLLPNRTRRRPHPDASSILVTTGGSDTKNLGQTWPSLLSVTLEPGTRVNWLKGPFARMPRIPSETSLEFQVFEGLLSLDELIPTAQVALCVHGITAFELASSGVPVVSYSPYGEKDRREFDELGQFGFIEVSSSPEEAVSRLRNLIAEPQRRKHNSNVGRNLLRERGELTFLREVDELMNKTRGAEKYRNSLRGICPNQERRPKGVSEN